MKKTILLALSISHSLICSTFPTIPLTASASNLSWAKLGAAGTAIGGAGYAIHALSTMHEHYTHTPCYQSDIPFKKFTKAILKQKKNITFHKHGEEKNYEFTINDFNIIKQNFRTALCGGVAIVIAGAIIIIEELANETK